jgi:hypothetical protein
MKEQCDNQVRTVQVKQEKNERAKAEREKSDDCAREADQANNPTSDTSQNNFEDIFGPGGPFDLLPWQPVYHRKVVGSGCLHGITETAEGREVAEPRIYPSQRAVVRAKQHAIWKEGQAAAPPLLPLSPAL